MQTTTPNMYYIFCSEEYIIGMTFQHYYMTYSNLISHIMLFPTTLYDFPISFKRILKS